MSLLELLSHWRADPSIAGNVTAWKKIPRREPSYSPFPPDLHPRLQNTLIESGISQLYQHQAAVWSHVQNGSHTAVVTGTASGKTLAYHLPVINRLLKEPSCRALYLYPTKALAHDQLSTLNALCPLPAATYDGDTPIRKRPLIREKSRIIATNPDMLHLGILPHHTEWQSLFQNLTHVILDEMHIYRGVFGSHVANVIRRLKRIAASWGSHPVFISTSATINNPGELAERLIEEKVELVCSDQSARGEKHFLIYNPPIIDPDLGLRAGMQQESERLVGDTLSYQLQTILFGRTRKSVEFMISRLRKSIDLPDSALAAYRSGYLPSHRRELEQGLRTGRIRLIAATNALELGIDIGGLDAAVLSGYPGTISSTWQQAGRSGRSDKPSLSILVTSSAPLDQYLAQHPDYFFDRSPEQALINPDNVLILLDHIQCAAFELPFRKGESFGNLSLELTEEFLTYLASAGLVYESKGTYYWMKDRYPAGDLSLRTTSPDQVLLKSIDSHGRSEVIGTVDYHSVHWMVHPGAVYLHQGETFLVDALDLESKSARLRSVSPDYYTEPVRKIDVLCLRQVESKRMESFTKYLGELRIETEITGYKKFRWSDHQVLGLDSLDLPPTELETNGFWISLTPDLIEDLKESGSWNSGKLDYGPDWSTRRQNVLERDGKTCQVCGSPGSSGDLHVHHLQPLRSFRSLREANRLENLITVCPRCHRRLENVVKIRSGLSGLTYTLHHLAPLFLMCDYHDLGSHGDPESSLGGGLPTVILYENIPAGLGFSKALYEKEEDLLQRSLDLIVSCPCTSGCPSCVGPGGESGRGSKQETSAILKRLISSS